MGFCEKTRQYFISGRWVEQACLALLVFCAASLLAPYHWIFDLLVNFQIQYAVGAFVLCVLFALYRRTWPAVGMAVLGVALFLQMQGNYTAPFATKPDAAPNFRVVQYNKLYDNNDYDDIYAWLREHSNDFDVVVVNESIRTTINPLKELKDIYPYQSPESIKKRFGDISILSRWPITVTPLPIARDGTPFNGSKIIVQKPGVQPVTIYAHHAQVPGGQAGHDDRAYELESLANFALTGQESGEKNIIMMGDWNVTPFSPQFKKIVKISGLNYQNYGLMPAVTWPSFTGIDALRIPIDHFLFDNNLILTDISSGLSLGSDHRSLIAAFRVNPAE